MALVCFQRRLICWVGILFLWGVALPEGWAIDSQKPYDIYLTGDRICKKCTFRVLSPESVELSNRLGEKGIYPVKEIIGLDTHPFARRFVLQNTHANGLAGRIVVPQAFDDEKYLHY